MKKNLVYTTVVAMVLTLGIGLASCQSEGKKQSFEGVVKYDSLSVDIDFPFLSSYPSLTPVYYRDALYAAGFNRFTHNIDMLNLSGGQHREIVVEREGPNGVTTPTTFCFNEDRFVIRERVRITVMDIEGKVIQRFPIEELVQSKEDVEYSFYPKGPQSVGFAHIKECNGEAFIPLTTVPKKADTSIGAVLDLEKEEFSLLPIHYPEDILPKMEGWNNMVFPHIMPSEDRLVISFPCSSKVYVYDRASRQMTDFNMSSAFLEDELPAPPKTEDVLRTFTVEMSAARYREVHYSPRLHKYYRLVWKESIRGEDKLSKRQMYLTVYDEHTAESKEYELPSPMTYYQYMVYEDVLYVGYKSDTDDFFSFAKIDIAQL